jgi:putative ABC transport system permease protein
VFGAVQARLAAEYPEESAGWTGVGLTPLRSELLGDVRPTLAILAAAAALVLLLSCANVATLSLIRASVRARELAVRSALGAGRGRIARQLFAESTVVALAGGALGVLLAAGIVRWVRAAASASLPRADEIAVDGRVLALALLVSLVAALVVGAAPALRATRPALADQLRGTQRGSSGGRADARLRGLLVSLQFAVTVVLLVASALLVQSFRRLQDVPLGFDPEPLVAVRITPPPARYGSPAQALALYDRLRDAARLVPGVRSAALVNHLPLSGSSVPSRVDVQGRDADPRRPELVVYRTASAEYLATAGMRVVRGRWFAPDDMRSPEAAGFVVNETMARQLWPGGDAVGQVITLRRSSQARADFGQPISGAVIGVVGDVRQFGRDVDVAPEAFVPYTREVWPWITLVVRADDPARAIPALRKAVLGVDPDLPVGGRAVVPVRSLLADTLARRRLALSLLGAFGGGALLLAAVGLYGAIAYSVTQRTRELGIRLALGATRASVLRLVLRGGLTLALAGGAAGLVGAAAAARGIRAMLFETAPTDPASYLAGAALLAVVALAASYGPARRAVRLEPTVAMRDE